MDVAAEFAALVEKAAREKSSPPPPSIVPQTAPTAYVEFFQVVTTNGPDSSDTNSIPAPECMSPGSNHTPGKTLPINKQQIVDVEESSNITRVVPSTISPVTGTPPAWKQGQLPHLTSVSLKSNLGGSNCKIDVSNQAVIDEKFGQAKLEVEQQVVDFVPSVSATEQKISQPISVVVKNLESTPVVSAQTDAPTVEVGRNSGEQFPALKHNTPIHQSPRRKQSQHPERASIFPQATTVASISFVQSTPVVSGQTDSPTVEVGRNSREQFPALKNNTPIHQSPRRKQPQHPEGASIFPQATTVASISFVQSTLPPVVAVSRDTSAVETNVSKKPASTDEPTPQDFHKDRDKSGSLGKDRDNSSTKEAIASPCTAVPVTPAVATAASQPQPQQPPSATATGTAEGTQQQTNGEVAAAEVMEGEYVFVVKFACGNGLQVT
jgi:hypothetical protein